MEKSNLLVNGGMKLPIGYRFHPTDEELLLHYLRRKVFGVPLPASVIPELDVFQADPWSLPGNLKEKRYFFGRKWGNDSENGCKKAAGSGYWKPIGKGRQIVASFGNHIAKMKLGDWVVYRVFQRKRRPRKHGNIISQPSNTNNIQTTHEVMRSSFTEFIMEENSDMGPPQPSSPCSSGVTDEVSSSGLDKEEISSSISFSFHSYMKKT
ncbi:hypothetical protein GH714_032259 [Hevea brasiliensis]|uniref:NAC domain-containing protein n=1 Tax=Hevea brasiliensis TaxID=3981 RepID=A0A6A6NBD6_HEVBR|nr:hypothetical protein GH714_032259 [Hevea brasiliensis]